jgi:hypothetical protein
MYHWDWHQYRFSTFYCKVLVGTAEIRVMKGYDSEDPLKSFFLDPEHLARMKQVYGPKIEQAFIETRAYDERGLQYGSPKPFELRRVEGERWYIESYAQPF